MSALERPRMSGRETFLPTKFVEQCLGVLQNGRIEPLGEPAVDRGEEIAGCIAFALLAPEPGKTDRGAQLPELRTLLLRDADSLGKGALGSSGVVTRAQQLSADPMQLGLGPPLLSLGYQLLGLSEVDQLLVSLFRPTLGLGQQCEKEGRPRHRPRCAVCGHAGSELRN